MDVNFSLPKAVNSVFLLTLLDAVYYMFISRNVYDAKHIVRSHALTNPVNSGSHH